MRIPAFFKHPALEWVLWLGIPLGLYLSGWHTEAIGQVQRLVLATGLADVRTTDLHAGARLAQQPAASYDVTLHTLDGQAISLRTLKGKVIFMNFWATWCPPCVAEMPGIQKLYERTESEDVAFVMISVDKDFDKLQRFMRRKKYTFPVYQLAGGSLPALYASQSIPTTFVISSDGKLTLRHEGMADYNTSDFRDFLLGKAVK